MKTLDLKSTTLLLCSLFLLAACGSGGGDGDGEKSSDPDVAAAEFGSKVLFEGGTYNKGAPPVPKYTLNQNTVDGGTYTAGSSGNTLSMDISDVVAGESLVPSDPLTFNIAFNGQGSGAAGAAGFTTIDTTVANLSSGTFTSSFSVPSDVCNNLADIQHQIDCYESVTLPDGTVISTDQARQMVLACDSGNFNGGDFSGPGSFCAYNYPKDACDIIQQDYPKTAFTAGSGSGTCSGYPNVSYTYDYEFTGSEGIGQVGACVVAY